MKCTPNFLCFGNYLNDYPNPVDHKIIPLHGIRRSVEQLSSPGECDSALSGLRPVRPSGVKSGRGRGSAWGSISRVFARSRHRTKPGNASSGHESGMFYTFLQNNEALPYVTLFFN